MSTFAKSIQMSNYPRLNKALPYILLLILAMIWGSSFILIKKGLRSFSPFEIGTYRIAASYFVLLAISAYHIRRVKGKDFLFLAIVGLFGNFFPALLFAFAQQMIPSSLAGILNSAVPIFVVITGVLLFSSKFTRWQIIGVFVGLFGSTLISIGGGAEGTLFNVDNLLGSGIVLLATICYAISLNTIKNKLPNMRSVHITAHAFFIIGPIATFLLLTQTNFVQKALEPSRHIDLLAITFLSLIGTAFALILFNYIIKRSSAVFASYVTYLIPLVALLWGLLDGEHLYNVQLLGGVVVLIGVVLSRKKR